MRARQFIVFVLTGLILPAPAAHAGPVFDPSEFSGLPYLDYSSSPVGVIPPDSVMTDQYAPWGVRHDGHTTTPPGPPGISSYSGLPALDAGTEHQLPILTIDITFPDGVTEVGAFYLMGHPGNAIKLSVFDEAMNLIEAVKVLPEEMPYQPGPYDFNEGFVGLATDVPFTTARFQADNTTFVIDDLHFTPEPATLLLLALGGVILILRRHRSVRHVSGIE